MFYYYIFVGPEYGPCSIYWEKLMFNKYTCSGAAWENVLIIMLSIPNADLAIILKHFKLAWDYIQTPPKVLKNSCVAVAQYASGFFLFQDIPSCCTSYLQCLCNGSGRFHLFSKLQSGLLSSESALWSSCWFIFSNTNAVSTGKTQC